MQSMILNAHLLSIVLDYVIILTNILKTQFLHKTNGFINSLRNVHGFAL